AAICPNATTMAAIAFAYANRCLFARSVLDLTHREPMLRYHAPQGGSGLLREGPKCQCQHRSLRLFSPLRSWRFSSSRKLCQGIRRQSRRLRQRFSSRYCRSCIKFKAAISRCAHPDGEEAEVPSFPFAAGVSALLSGTLTQSRELVKAAKGLK